jgi:THUMP domain-containing protein
MDDSSRSFREALEYRIAVRLFNSAFEACNRLSQSDRDALLKEIAKRVLDNLPQVHSKNEQNPAKIVGIEITQL